jgi:hypothetical protein
MRNVDNGQKHRRVPQAIGFVLLLLSGSVLPASSQDLSQPRHIGLVQDWSSNRVVFTGADLSGPSADPRRLTSSGVRANGSGHGDVSSKTSGANSIDWSVSLGNGRVAPNMSPAKYSFDVNATPDCVNDFVVYALNVAGSTTQANVVGLNYLYSGSTPVNGVCNNLAGNGASAKVMWAYNTGSSGNSTSPVLSADGTKVAFVSNSSPAVFHVMAWTAGQGTVTAPVAPNASQMSNVTLIGSTGDTLSSPYIDYSNDLAYVGSDNGILYLISGVFNGTPVLIGTYTVAAGKQLSAPVWVDSPYNRIYVGAADGKLYAVTPDLASSASVQVGDGNTFGGITDPPLLDSSNDFVYVTTGSSLSSLGASGGALIVQVPADSTNFTQANLRVAAIGAGATVNVHGATFNDAYYSAFTDNIGTASEWFVYVCGPGGPSSKKPNLYRVGFNTSRLMNTATNTSIQLATAASQECSPLTEFLNGADRLYVGVTTGIFEYFDISSSTTPAQSSQITESGGTSAIVVDNISSLAQASSVYFSTLSTSSSCGSAYCAVKLTQATLQ